MTRTVVRSAVLAMIAVIALAPVALARDVSDEEFGVLAQRARTDPAALQQLRDVSSVDGVPVNIDRVLAGASPADVDARLRSLSVRGGGAQVHASSERDNATRILSGRKYQEAKAPKPFAGPLHSLGDWLDRNIGRHLPGGSDTLKVIFAVLLLSVLIAIVVLLSRRREKARSPQVAVRESMEAPESAKTLERRADEAERAGDLATAIRLRFRAGLLRLDDAGAIEYSPHLTAGQARRTLHNTSFDVVASSFEEVTYGGRTPTPVDAAASKDGWGNVLKQVSV